MKKWWLIVLAIAAITMFLAGCGEDDPDPPEIHAPSATAIAYADSIKLIWGHSPEIDEEGFRGYILYAIMNVTSFPPDTDGYALWTEPQLINEFTISEYRDTPLSINSLYYFGLVAVREVDGVDSLSPMTTVQTSPVMMGTDTLYELSETNPCAFSFEDDTAITALDVVPDPQFCIMSNAESTSVFGIRLASPHLAGLGWTTENEVILLGIGNLDSFSVASEAIGADSYDATLKVYQINCGDNYAKVVVTEVTGVTPNKRIVFDWKYQNKNNYPYF